FLSCRRRHTRFSRDWSSDVCSSDLGLQHPNGDALTVSESFFRNGGGDVYVMMQDVYQQWPYEDLGLEDYLGKVDAIVRDVAAHRSEERRVGKEVRAWVEESDSIRRH